MRSEQGNAALKGALAGLVATGAMTKVAKDWVQIRHPGTELHYHPKTNLQWAVQRLGRREPLPEHAAVPLAQWLHYGYGALVGAGFAVVRGDGSQRFWAVRGGGYGLLLWLVSFCGYIPLLGIYKPGWRFDAQEREVTLLAHTTYGVALSAILEAFSTGRPHHDELPELAERGFSRPRPSRWRDALPRPRRGWAPRTSPTGGIDRCVR